MHLLSDEKQRPRKEARSGSQYSTSYSLRIPALACRLTYKNLSNKQVLHFILKHFHIFSLLSNFLNFKFLILF